MVRLSSEELEAMQGHLDDTPTFDNFPWVEGPPLNRRRVCIITTAGVHLPGDRPFQLSHHDTYRVIPGSVKANDLVMSHGEGTFDRSAFRVDGNMCFPIDRLKEMAEEGIIGSVADFHYSFGAPMTDEETEISAREIAQLLKNDRVTACIFPSPV